MSYPEDSVGALMDFDVVTIREDVTLEVVLRYLRRLDDFRITLTNYSWWTGTSISRACCR